MEIRSLEKTELETICKVFCQAFADYEIQINVAELKTTLKRRGFRSSGFAWLRLPLNFLRGRQLQVRTALSAGLLPQSRKTAR